VCWNSVGQITRRFYTFQRVNGMGHNGGAEDGGGPHRHDIGVSDQVKKNSVVRWLAKSNKEPPKRKAAQVQVCILIPFLSWALALIHRLLCHFFAVHMALDTL
jgi:hypothetical protein